MNQLEKALFELRIDMARNPTATSEAELDAMLAEVVEDSDASVRATVEFFNLNMDAIGERAGKMQFDGGASRVTANRLALTEELQRTIPRMSGTMCRWFAQNMASACSRARHEPGRTRRGTPRLFPAEPGGTNGRHGGDS